MLNAGILLMASRWFPVRSPRRLRIWFAMALPVTAISPAIDWTTREANTHLLVRAFTQGLLATLVADTSPPELRGTAYGFFNLLGGFAMLAASVIAGSLWDVGGARMTFLTGAGFSLVALIGLLAVKGRIGERVATAVT